MARIWSLVLPLLLIMGFVAVSVGEHQGPPSKPGKLADIVGKVEDESGPVAGATVRIKGTDRWTTTDKSGRFKIPGLFPRESVVLTASAAGYYIGGGLPQVPGSQEVAIKLRKYRNQDNPAYQWLPSRPLWDQPENEGCAECHSNKGRKLTVSLPVEEWLSDAHSKSARNEQFLTMYEGTDVFGRPARGPGYRLDYKDSAGICSTCHTPAAAVNAPFSTDPRNTTGVLVDGISCDFCHKITDVRIDPATRLPDPHAPGVLSLEFHRPPEGRQFFAGPLDDVAPFDDAYLPLYRESRYCASCHYGVFEGTTIYNSYGEWLESPYANPANGATCQDCHMAPSGVVEYPKIGTTVQWPTCVRCHKAPDGRVLFAKPDKGAIGRISRTVFSHQMPGASDAILLTNAVSLQLTARKTVDHIVAEVNITNDKTGHHVPTDSPLRQMLLLVRARNADGSVCQLLEGSTLPAWCGTKTGTTGHYGGLPGKAFAKILQELNTGISPSGAYWNPTRVVSDNRLPAMASDLSTYTFSCENQGPVTVEARLLYRRAFVDLMDVKGWKIPDILMEEESVTVPSQTASSLPDSK